MNTSLDKDLNGVLDVFEDQPIGFSLGFDQETLENITSSTCSWYNISYDGTKYNLKFYNLCDPKFSSMNSFGLRYPVGIDFSSRYAKRNSSEGIYVIYKSWQDEARYYPNLTNAISSEFLIKNITFSNEYSLIPTSTLLQFNGLDVSGKGYVKLVKEGTYLPAARALLHVDINETFGVDIIYELLGYADFLNIKPQLIGGLQQEFSYKLGKNSLNDKIYVPAVSYQNFSLTGPNCWNYLAHSFICSEDSEEFSYPLFSSLAYTKSIKKACFGNYTLNQYLMRIEGYGGEFIIPFSKGNCEGLAKKFYLIERYGLPVSVLGDLPIPVKPGEITVWLVYWNPKIDLTNYARFPKGEHLICIKKVGEEKMMIQIEIKKCY